MNGIGLKPWGWGVGCVALGLVACDPNTEDFETPGSGATTGSGGSGNAIGGNGNSTGGSRTGGSATGGGRTTTSATSTESGGTGGTATETSATGAGGIPATEIWPELPSERGTVADLDPYDFEASHCCSRAPEHPESAECPRGADHQWTAAINQAEMDIQTTFTGTPATSPVSLHVTSPTNTTPVELYLWETELPPPEGILALSPIYWIGASGAFPSLSVRLPFTTNEEVPHLDPFAFLPPGEVTSMLYFSADGLVYERFVGSVIHPMSGQIEKPGFMFIGAQADEWACAAPTGLGGAASE